MVDHKNPSPLAFPPASSSGEMWTFVGQPPKPKPWDLREKKSRNHLTLESLWLYYYSESNLSFSPTHLFSPFFQHKSTSHHCPSTFFSTPTPLCLKHHVLPHSCFGFLLFSPICALNQQPSPANSMAFTSQSSLFFFLRLQFLFPLFSFSWFIDFTLKL